MFSYRVSLRPNPPLKHGDVIIWGHDFYWICYKHRGIYTISSFTKRLFVEDGVPATKDLLGKDLLGEDLVGKDLFHGMEDGFFYEEDNKNND